MNSVIFQPHIGEVLQQRLRGYVVTISVEGVGKPSVPLFRTSFWPDAEIKSELRAKHISPGKSASEAIAGALGQAATYKSRYERVIAFVLHEGIYNPSLVTNDHYLNEWLEANGIVLRRREAAAKPASSSTATC